MSTLNAFSLKEWIEEHRHLLKPPVGNQVVWEDTDIIVMIVGGPNKRKDFHINQTEEFFHQLEGDIVLRVKEDGEYRDIQIREGDVMLLPPGIPHSPQRGKAPRNDGGPVRRLLRKVRPPGFPLPVPSG